jgi:cell wall-associated NlpC family hydrolase
MPDFSYSRGFSLSTLLLSCLLLIVATMAFVIFDAGEPVSAPAITLPAEIYAQLQPGDLIFRIGDDWQSEVVRGVANTRQEEKQGDPYSHVGMLVGSQADWQVVHAVPSEKPGQIDGVVQDDLDFYLAPERAQGVAIYRVAAPDAARAAAVAYVLQRLGTPFRIVKDDRVGEYCTTLVWAAWQHAGVDLGARFEFLEVPFSKGEYLLPHSLRTAPGLQLVFDGLADSN